VTGCVLDSGADACVDGRDDEAFFDDFVRRALRGRVPLNASLELTHRCNLRCVHCYLGDQDSIRAHRHEELTTAEVEALLDELADAGTLNFTFTGGDPMLRRDFPRLYERAVRNGFLVTVFCDGAVITPRVREVFVRLPPRKVEVSVYGASREVYEDVTQVAGSFARCMEGIEWLAASGIRFTLKTVLLTRNRHELDAMRALAQRFGAPFYFDSAVFPCLPHGDAGGRANARRGGRDPALGDIPVRLAGRDAPLALRLDPQAAAAAQLADADAVAELVELYLRTRDLAADGSLYRCGAARTTVHVDPYGNLQACTISTGGGCNVREGGFAKGWNGPLARLRERTARAGSACAACDKQALCAGCPAFFEAETGSPHERSEHVCRTTHLLFEGLRPALAAHLESES